jgi:hypothetical protein
VPRRKGEEAPREWLSSFKQEGKFCAKRIKERMGDAISDRTSSSNRIAAQLDLLYIYLIEWSDPKIPLHELCGRAKQILQ